MPFRILPPASTPTSSGIFQLREDIHRAKGIDVCSNEVKRVVLKFPMLAKLHPRHAAGIDAQEVGSWKLQSETLANCHFGSARYLPALAVVKLGFYYHYQRESSARSARLGEDGILPAGRAPDLGIEKEDAELLLGSVLDRRVRRHGPEVMRG